MPPRKKILETEVGIKSSKKEKIWKLDCESIDTIVPIDVTRAAFPAFITNGDKCIIRMI